MDATQNEIKYKKRKQCFNFIPTSNLETKIIQPNVYLSMQTGWTWSKFNLRDNWSFESLWATRPLESSKFRGKIVPRRHRRFNKNHNFGGKPPVTVDENLCRLKDDLEIFFTNEFHKLAKNKTMISEHPWLEDFINSNLRFNATVINYYQNQECINWHADGGIQGPIVSLTFFNKPEGRRIFSIKDNKNENLFTIETCNELLLIMSGHDFQITHQHRTEKPKEIDEYRRINITCRILK